MGNRRDRPPVTVAAVSEFTASARPGSAISGWSCVRGKAGATAFPFAIGPVAVVRRAHLWRDEGGCASRCGSRFQSMAQPGHGTPSELSQGCCRARFGCAGRQHGGRTEAGRDGEEHSSVRVCPDLVVSCTDVGLSRVGHHAKYQPLRTLASAVSPSANLNVIAEMSLPVVPTTSDSTPLESRRRNLCLMALLWLRYRGGS